MDKRRNGRRVFLIILIVAVLMAIGVLVWAFFFQTSEILVPDRAPKQEQNAEALNDTDEKLDEPEGGGSVSLTYSKDVKVDISERQVSLLFANPSKSNRSMVLQITVQNEAVAQSGTLEPGFQVTTLDLLEGVDQKIIAGEYEGQFEVFYYQQDTGDREVITTEIPVSISVVE